MGAKGSQWMNWLKVSESQKNLYKHFSSKEDLVIESWRHYLDKIRVNVDYYIQEEHNEQ